MPGPAAPAPERRIRNPLDPRNPLSGVYLATMLFELAEGGLRFLLPIHLAGRGVGEEGIGFVVAVFAATSLGARAIAGGAFRYDRARRLIILAGVASTGAFIFLPFTDSALGAALLMAGDGFGWGMATTVLLAIVMTISPRTMSSASAMGWYVGFQGIALALATTVGGVLAQLIGVEPAMLVLATVPALAGVLIALRLPHPDDTRIPAGATAAEARARRTLRQHVVGAPGAIGRTLVGLPAVVWAAALV
ncbi:MAG: MFS transporter, partial [Chloroflexota bacterium]